MTLKSADKHPTRSEEAEQRSPQLDISRDLLRVQEEERKRISRELHDETGQGLMLLRMYVDSLAGEAATNDELRQRFHEALSLLDQTIEGLRRIIGRLSPRVLEEMGLLAALRKAVADFKRNSGKRVRMRVPETIEGIDEETSVAIYRTVQEGLNNAARHSQAENVLVVLEIMGDFFCLVIRDDGIGFQQNEPGKESFGLSGMRDRICALGGTLQIGAPRNKGTELKAMVPVRTVLQGPASKNVHSGRTVA